MTHAASTTRARRTPYKSRAKAGAPPILVATAGEAESIGALRLTAALAAADKAAVVVLGVAPPFPHNVATLLSMRQPVSIDEHSRRDLQETVRRSLEGVPGADSWQVRAFTGTPADAINEAASRWKTRMIILGLGRHGRLARIFGRETAVEVMRRARLPVIAVHPKATGLPVRAVVALDFTVASLSAATVAASVLAANGTLYLAHVCAFGEAKAKRGDLVDVYRAGARTKLDEVVKQLRRRTSRRVEGLMLTGDPGRAIVAYATRSRSDLIALGGHRLALVDRILLGSVRTRVVRDAPCSVLIAPPDPRDAGSNLDG
jgi:nucleotide-binding universal stress UspA family protein